MLWPFPAVAAAADVDAEPTRRNMPKNRGRVRVGVVGLVGDVSLLLSWLLSLPGGVVGPPLLLSEPISEEAGLAPLLPISMVFAFRPFGGDGGRNARVSVSDCSSRVVLSEVLVLE